MTQDYGDSGAPVLGPVTQEERKAAIGEPEQRRAAATLLDQQPAMAPPPEGLQKMRAFVAAREHSNGTFLVVTGKPVGFPAGYAVGSSVEPLRRRDGDKWANFKGGVLVTDDPDVIDWCLAHPKVCRPQEDPMTKSWATIKDMQAQLANRDVVLPASDLDAEETFPVNMMEKLIGQAQAAKKGSTGAEAVEAAEVSLEVTERRLTERAAESDRLMP